MSDEDEETTIVQYLPVWRFSRWDTIAAVCHVAGGVANAVSQGFSHVAQAAAAHANWDRQQREIHDANVLTYVERKNAEAEMAAILNLPEAEK